MGLYGHQSPKPSWLLGSPLDAQYMRILIYVKVLLQLDHGLDTNRDWIELNQPAACSFALRKWIDNLESKMSKDLKDALPCYAGDSTVKMVNKYIDRSGNNRVWGA